MLAASPSLGSSAYSPRGSPHGSSTASCASSWGLEVAGRTRRPGGAVSNPIDRSTARAGVVRDRRGKLACGVRLGVASLARRAMPRTSTPASASSVSPTMRGANITALRASARRVSVGRGSVAGFRASAAAGCVTPSMRLAANARLSSTASTPPRRRVARPARSGGRVILPTAAEASMLPGRVPKRRRKRRRSGATGSSALRARGRCGLYSSCPITAPGWACRRACPKPSTAARGHVSPSAFSVRSTARMLASRPRPADRRNCSGERRPGTRVGRRPDERPPPGGRPMSCCTSGRRRSLRQDTAQRRRRNRTVRRGLALGPGYSLTRIPG